MGNTFSVTGFYRNKSIPSDWSGLPEEYEALKSLMYEYMDKNNELYQMLYGVYGALKKSNGPRYAREFVEYGYIELINEIIKKKYLNYDILSMAFTVLRNIIDAFYESGYTMVNECMCLKVVSEVVQKLVKKDSLICATTFMSTLAQFYTSNNDIDVNDLYPQLLKLMQKHHDNITICSSVMTIFTFTLNPGNVNNIPTFLKSGGMEKVFWLLSEYPTNDTITFGCFKAFGILSFSRDGARDIVQMGGIEAIVEYIRTRRDPETLCISLHSLQGILWESTSTRLRALNLGIVDAIRNVVNVPGQSEFYPGFVGLCLATLFSVDPTFKRDSEREVAYGIVNSIPIGTNERVRRRLEHSRSIIRRVEDPRACECRKARVCSRTRIRKCGGHGGFMYCDVCGTPQFLFRCFTCGDSLKVYCLACKERCHKGHKGETFFFAANCDCENSKCCSPPPMSSSSSPPVPDGENDDDDWVFV